MPNIFDNLPTGSNTEHFEPIVSGRNIRIERIISNENSTPAGEWYDQPQKEWVMILEGHGVIEFEEGRLENLKKGDHILIKAHERHRVTHTGPDAVWLAVHFD